MLQTNRSLTSLLVASLFLLSGCLGFIELPGRGAESNVNRLTGLQDIYYEYRPLTVDGGTFTATNLPSWAVIDSSTGVISGYPDAPGVYSGIVVTATGANGLARSTSPFEITIAGDPFAAESWALVNRGQAAFSKSTGIAGEDLNVREALNLGVTGAGVKIAVSDTGTDAAHPDLSPNFLLNLSKNYNLSATGPWFGNPGVASGNQGDHGTSVAGIIAAKGWNSIGSRGIAPDAMFATYNYISSSQEANIDLDQLTGDVDIFNQSWGNDFSDDETVSYSPLATSYKELMRAGVTNLRANKGAVYVRAAGNDYFFFVLSEDPLIWISLNANLDELNTTPEAIVTAALDARGKKASYSSIGSCLWISGTAGEFGETSPATVTTDVSGCNSGYARLNLSRIANVFQLGQAGNTNCDYTSTFNGTSAASPSVSGVVALMLQANPRLTWREVKHILASTADQVDANFQPFQHPLDPEGYFSEPGWTTNAAGYRFHNWYGFGRANAGRAVEMAKSFVSNFGALKETVNANGTWKFSVSPNLPIPDDDVVNGAVSTIEVTDVIDAVESVQIEISATHPQTLDLGFELTSPSGTKNIVLPIHSGSTAANFNQVRFLSNAFYGERGNGVWRLKAIDGAATDSGTLTNWKINVLGH